MAAIEELCSPVMQREYGAIAHIVLSVSSIQAFNRVVAVNVVCLADVVFKVESTRVGSGAGSAVQ